MVAASNFDQAFDLTRMSSPDSGSRQSLQEAIEASNKSAHKSSGPSSISDSHFFTSLKSTVFPTFQRARSYFPDAQDTIEKAEEKRRLGYEKLLSTGILDGPRLVKNSPFVVATGGLLTGGALGFIGSALQNAVQPHNHGWKGVFTRTGSTIWGFGTSTIIVTFCMVLYAMIKPHANDILAILLALWFITAFAGGIYGFVDTYVGNVREEDDAFNKFAGGCAAGFFLGMRGTFWVLDILFFDE